MRISRTLAVGILATLWLPAASSSAQSRPSLEGTWTLALPAAETQRVTIVAESGDAAFKIGDMGSGWGSTLAFSRRADRLVLEYQNFSAYDLMPPLHYEFAVDGAETINAVTIGPSVTTLRSRASWRGDTLDITTRQAVPREVGGAEVVAEVRRTLVLTAPDTLQIVTTRVGIAGAPTNVVRSTYIRKR
jgi:hypothetical protein